MNEETQFLPTVHHGHNIKQLREILGVKQDATVVKHLLKAEQQKIKSI